MIKSLFGGGAVLTAALLLCSLTFYAQTLVAENKPAVAAVAFKSQTRTTTGAPANTVAHESGFLSGSLMAALPVIALTGISKDVAAGVARVAAANARTEPGRGAFELTQRFMATAYALPGLTASGHAVRRGLIAADNYLPLGTRVRLDAGHYSGEYVVADRGGRVRGRTIDIWVPSNGEALRFGRRPVKLTILSYGAKRAKRTGKRRS